MSKSDWFVLTAFVTFGVAIIGIMMYLTYTLTINYGIWDVRVWMFAVGMVYAFSNIVYYIVTYGDNMED